MLVILQSPFSQGGHMLCSADIVTMRAQITAALPDTCDILRVTRTPDGAGGFEEAETAVGTHPCRVTPTSTNETQIAARLSTAATWAVTLPAGTDVQENDRIVSKGRTWEVAHKLEYPYGLSTRLLCREVR